MQKEVLFNFGGQDNLIPPQVAPLHLHLFIDRFPVTVHIRSFYHFVVKSTLKQP